MILSINMRSVLMTAIFGHGGAPCIEKPLKQMLLPIFPIRRRIIFVCVRIAFASLEKSRVQPNTLPTLVGRSSTCLYFQRPTTPLTVWKHNGSPNSLANWERAIVFGVYIAHPLFVQLSLRFMTLLSRLYPPLRMTLTYFM